MKIFNQGMASKPKRSMFDLGHERKFSMNMGQLIPILCEEVVPGDTFQMNTEVLMRLAPLVSPVMHRVNVYTHFFFVPNRLIWDEWKDFITGGDKGNKNPVFPHFLLNGASSSYFAPGTLADYLGIATGNLTEAGYKINALPFRAYANIYNEYYRDQNLQDPIEFLLSSGTSNGDWPLVRDVRTRAWEKDYFTSALPWTQKGGDVTLPMSGDAPVKLRAPGQIGTQKFLNADTRVPFSDEDVMSGANGSLKPSFAQNGVIDPGNTLYADLSQVSSSTIEELRRATKLQMWLEKNARSGSRYIEQILAHFGVRSSDARLQRPEFLGGGKTPVTISEVLQTSSTDASSPQANMAGHGIAVGNSHSFKKFFEEHGYVIGIMSVLPRTAYQQGTRRVFKKFDRFDYYWPEFAQLGEQPVYNYELFDQHGVFDDNQTFGYQSRYSEYKYIPSSVHGDFKSNLSYWHMGRQFANLPTLNEEFIKADPTHRIFAVSDPTKAKLYVQIYNNLKAIRPMPYFNVPNL